jgi:hypothetical protein
MPRTFGLGTAVDVSRGPSHTVTLAGSLRYALWSDYQDRHGERPEDGDPGLAFKDVFAGTAGVRYETGPLHTFADLNYQPTPVPPQTGRRNYVDNDRVGAILGSDYEFPLFGLSFRAGAQAQAHRLLHRHQTKDNARIVDELPDDAVDESGQPVPGAGGLQTNNPGWPGFASEGWILGGAITLALLY